VEDPILLLARALLTALPAAWLSLGVLDNILYPEINRDEVARVLRLESLAHHPEVLKKVARRRIDNPAVVRRIFRTIVLWELVTAALLWAGSIGLAGTLVGAWAGEWPRTTAALGILAFTLTWTAFLIAGQWFYYWFGNHGQQTHLLATLWGIATLAILLV
jgi:predicted small integral membrane protein